MSTNQFYNQLIIQYNIILKTYFTMTLSLKSTINTTSPLYTLYQDNKYMFIVGRNICIKHFKQQNYTYIPLFDQTEQVIQLKITSNRKSAIIIQRVNKDDIYLSLYYFNKERKSIKLTSKPIKKCIVTPGISQSSVINICLCYGDDYQLMYIDANKMKIIASAFSSEAFLRIIFHPLQNNIISTLGKDFVRIYQIKDNGYQLINEPSKKINSIIYVCHCWSENAMIICNKSQVFVYSNQEITQKINVKLDEKQNITNITYFSRYFLLSTSKGTCLLYLKLNDNKYVEYEKVKVENYYIEQLNINNTQDIIIIRTQDLNFYITKFQEITQQQYKNNNRREVLSFQPVDKMVGSLEYQGVSICQTKSLGLFVSKNFNSIVIWNLQKNSCILRKQFHPKYKQDTSNLLLAGAIHPLGYSLVLAFSDRLKFYHLLVNDIQFYHQVFYKRVRGVKFSQGGNLLSFLYGKGKNCTIVLINVMTMVQICSLKTHSEIYHFLWSKNDSHLICGCEGNIVIWKSQDGFRQKHEIIISQRLNNVRYDNKSQKILVSTNNQIIEIENQKIVNRRIPQFKQFDYIFPFDNKYIITDKCGNIYLSNSLDFQRYQSLSICNSRGYLFYKGEILLYLSQNNSEVSIIQTKLIQKKNNQQEYVLISKDELIKNSQRIKYLENSIEIFQAEILSRMENQKTLFKKTSDLNQFNIQKQLNHTQKNYQNILEQKLKIQKESNQMYEIMEFNQIKAVDELELLYQKKLMIQRRKLLAAQESMAKQNMIFQIKFKQISEKHDRQIKIIRQQYEQNYRKLHQQIQQKKNSELSIKQRYQQKINQIDQQNQEILLNLQISVDSKLQLLNSKLLKSQQKYESKNMDYQKALVKIRSHQQKLEQQRLQILKLKKILQEQKNRISLLNRQVKLKDQLLEQKQRKILQYQNKITDLEKSKHILNFRTSEIRKQLEPKQSQIDKLKRQVFKLEAEHKDSLKENQNLGQKIQKLEKALDISKIQILQCKNKLKKNKGIYNQLTQQIYNIVKNIQPKLWNCEVLKIYNNYIQNSYFLDKKPQQSNIEQEINRHRIHLEESLYQINISNDRIMKGREKQIQKKYKQNSELIRQLNQMRKKQKEFKMEITSKNIEISRLKKQLNQSFGSTKRLSSAVTGISAHKKNTHSNIIQSGEESFRLINDHKKSEYLLPNQSKKRVNRALSANRTLRFKGPNFDQNTQAINQRTKVFQLLSQLDNSQNKINQLEKVIDGLNKKVMLLS